MTKLLNPRCAKHGPMTDESSANDDPVYVCMQCEIEAAQRRREPLHTENGQHLVVSRTSDTMSSRFVHIYTSTENTVAHIKLNMENARLLYEQLGRLVNT
jgi:hypothetical protein